MQYSAQQEDQIKAWALTQIAPKRHQHVEGVATTADNLAAQYLPEECQRARLAGWIHDAAKHLSDDDLLAQAQEFGLELSPSEQLVPMLLHGVIGYLRCATEFGLNDAQLFTACRYHTAGHPAMNTLDKIVFIADLIEPSRDFPKVEKLRKHAVKNLDKTMLIAAQHTLLHLIDKKRIIAPDLLDLRNRLLLERGK